MIPKDILEDWMTFESTKRVVSAMQQKKDNLTGEMQLGRFVNTDSMEQTFGQSSKAVGKMEGYDDFFDIINGRDIDET